VAKERKLRDREKKKEEE